MNPLPTEKIPPSRPKDTLLSLVIGCCILFAINLCCVIYLKKYNPNKAYALIQHKWQMIFDTQKKADWLILGDSSGNQGIDAQQFEQKKQGKALNLCTIADMLVVNDVWMLESYIKKQGAPKKLLLVHTYDIWHRENIPNGFLAQVPFFKKQELSMPHLVMPIWEKILMNMMPLNYQRASLSWLIQEPQQLFQTSFQCDKNGFEAHDAADKKEVLRDSQEHLTFVQSNEFKISKNNLVALEHLARLATQYSIQVYLANAPIYEKLPQDENFQYYYQKMQNFLTIFCQEKAWNYINIAPMTFSIHEMENVDHLTTTAAQRFTAQLIKEMQQ